MQEAIALAGFILLRDYYDGGFTLRPEMNERLDRLLRPLAALDQPVLPALRLDDRIAKLEALFPETARAAHLTRLPPVPC